MEEKIKDIRADCNFWSKTYKRCWLLKPMYYDRYTACRHCPFYKTKERYDADARAAVERCRRRGIMLPYTPMG